MKIHSIVVIVISVLLFSCGNSPEKEVKKVVEKKKKQKTEIAALVQPPIFELNPAFETIEVNVSQGGVFTVPNTSGSKIVVPKNIFVDEKRNPIVGKVEIKYREFHDAVDIFLAGIPMDYDAAKMTKRFETAGMFDIRAFSNGKEVFLDSGKVMKVIIGSNIEGNDYHQFKLDEKLTRNWHYVGENNSKPNKEKKKIIAALHKKVKATKIPLSPGHFAFNYLSVLDVYLKDDEKLILKSKKDEGIELKIKKYGVEWKNFFNYESITFNGNVYLASLMIWKKITEKEFPAWANSAETKITLKENNNYNIEFFKKGSGKVSYEIQAVMPLKSILQFSPEYWKKEYDKAFAEVMKSESEKLRTMADVYRTFEFNQMGIYNSDRLMKDSLNVQIMADVKFDREVGDIKNIVICYVGGDGKSLIKFPYDLWTNMTLVPDNNAKLFALLPDNYIALFDSEKYRKIDFKAIRKSGEKPRMTLEFTTVKKITSDEEMKEIVLGNYKPSL
jgi:hypothetical protein